MQLSFLKNVADTDIGLITRKLCYRRKNRTMHYGITENPTRDCIPPMIMLASSLKSPKKYPQKTFSFFTVPCTLVQSAVLRSDIVRLSVRLSVRLCVTFRYRDHIGWNSSKIISRPNSLRPLLPAYPNMGDLVQREHPQN